MGFWKLGGGAEQEVGNISSFPLPGLSLAFPHPQPRSLFLGNQMDAEMVRMGESYK